MSFARLSSAVRPLSVRLTLWHSLLFLSSALALLALTYVTLRNRVDANERDAISFRLWQYSSEYTSGGLDAVRRLSAVRKGREQKAFFVRVADAQNRAIFRRDPDEWAEFAPERLSGQPLPAAAGYSWQTLRSPAGTEMLIAAERLHDGGVIQVGKSNEELSEVLGEFRRSALLVLLIFVPASFAGGAFLASRALRPVKHVTDVAHEIVQTSRFDSRVPAPGSRDELDALVRVFNEMLDRIASLIRGMRDSLDNVAHDLRTPITRLRARALSAIEASEESAASAKCPRCEANLDALVGCVDEADRVGTMLNTLMDIAEAEAGLSELKTNSVFIAELTARAIDSYAEFAEEREITVLAEVPADLRIRADEMAMSRVFANLLDNAIKYTPPGGRVRISAAPSGDAVAISFSDTGVGIPPEDLPRIWERLFRSDRSRSERGLGLGLSFVRAIVEAHGGTVSAHSQPTEGTTITITVLRQPSGRPPQGGRRVGDSDVKRS
ncbi:MAG: HAMP domain-containing sensor histidine kinase [Chthoniobacteraceae bacterium]